MDNPIASSFSLAFIDKNALTTKIWKEKQRHVDHSYCALLGAMRMVNALTKTRNPSDQRIASLNRKLHAFHIQAKLVTRGHG